MDYNKFVNGLGQVANALNTKAEVHKKMVASDLRGLSDRELEQRLRKSRAGELSDYMSELVEDEARRRGLL